VILLLISIFYYSLLEPQIRKRIYARYCTEYTWDVKFAFRLIALGHSPMPALLKGPAAP